MLWATGCSHLRQENKSRSPTRKVLFIKITSYVVADMSGDMSGDRCKKRGSVITYGHCHTTRSLPDSS
jgi:hypothetical protein